MSTRAERRRAAREGGGPASGLIKVYDQVVRDGYVLTPMGRKMFLDYEADDPAVFLVQNIVDYLDGRPGKALSDFPSIAPVRPVMWFEWLGASGKQNRAARLDAFSGDQLADLLAGREHPPVLGDEWTDGVRMDNRFVVALENARELEGFTGTPKWALDIVVVLRTASGGPVQGPVGGAVFLLDELGFMVGNSWWATPHVRADAPEDAQDAAAWVNSRGASDWILSQCQVPMQSLAFLHCKNVRTEDHHPPATVRTRKGRIAPGPTGVAVFSTISLDVPRRGGSGGSAGGHDDRALHIVDGHFAHYGNCCPGSHEPKGRLFGRLEGVYWVESHARGNPERGSVTHDRDLRPPEEL